MRADLSRESFRRPLGSEAIGFDNFPEFSWVVEKTEELLLRIRRVFQQNPEMFRLLIYMHQN
jgi:hypothetical protein